MKEKKNPAVKQYLRITKHLFPAMGAKERQYLKKLELTILEYCEEEKNVTYDSICQTFGKPQDVLNDYLSTLDVSEMSKKIATSKWIKITIFTLVLLAGIATAAYAINLYKTFQVFKYEDSIDHIDTTIY